MYLLTPQALRLANPQQSGYVVRWPIYGTSFNTRDYPSVQFVLSDFEAILRDTLKERLNVGVEDYSVCFFCTNLTYILCAEIETFRRSCNSRLLWSFICPWPSEPVIGYNGVQTNMCTTGQFCAWCYPIIWNLKITSGIISSNIWCRNFECLCCKYWCDNDEYRMRWWRSRITRDKVCILFYYYQAIYHYSFL